ncbi:hypothetical protein [Sphingomonas solaris]|uniref:Uncharacterized protein n=1 Tax=Alterirhizorhabdus solaris TaxID=2529389 RepID=A0A558QUK9_9SPHN|nr:hypothetical protein [Sphingomonas solaris]TVV70799.1 hypothetical protein FOY91_18255 [Sphingomonas solaris]
MPIALAIAGGAGLAAGASAETLVVRSSGPSMKAYPPGKALADSARIVLKPNDQVVILDGRGTRTLKGPGTFSPTLATDRPADLRATFADVSGRRARPGAVRGVTVANTATAKSPNIWFVDIGRSSTQCVTDPARVILWRPDRAGESTLTISSAAGGSATVKWAAGDSTQSWPATLPVTAGAKYRLSWPGAAAPTTLTFALLGPNPTTGLEGMASALIKNGCEAQLDLLIETVAIPEAVSPAG